MSEPLEDFKQLLKNLESQSGLEGIVTRRFLARARAQSRHPKCVPSFNAIRKKWNQLEPLFAIDGSGEPGSPRLTQKLILPPSLQRLLDNIDAHPDWTQVQAHSAVWSWEELVGWACRSTWPPTDFPRLNDHWEPGFNYIANCIIYDPRVVEPSDWIHASEVVPEWISINPRDAEQALVDLLESVTLTADRIAAADNEANDRFEWALRDAIQMAESRINTTVEQLTAKVHDASEDLPGAAYVYLPIPASMASPEFRRAEQKVLLVAEYQMRRKIAKLQNDGVSETQIVKRLAVSREKVIANRPAPVAVRKLHKNRTSSANS